MNREIKFRAWNTDYKNPIMEYFVWNDIKKIERLQDKVITQFTGLHDKNGKEIYEGDIIKDYNATEPEDNGFIVLWEGFGWGIKLNDSVYQYVFELTETYSTLEIIGNIYENPNLCNT